MADQIRCEEAIKKLFEYLDGELGPEQSARIEHHIATCRSCFSRSEFERRLRARVADSAVAEAPDSLRERIWLLMERF